MKKVIIICAIVLIAMSVSGQSKLRAYSTSVTSLNEETSTFGEWSEPNPSTILIFLNKMTITIYSKETQNLSVISIGDIVNEEKGGTSITMSCIDGSGIKCSITIWSTEAYRYVFLQYSNVIFLYNCFDEP
jgi:hypothetical protein